MGHADARHTQPLAHVHSEPGTTRMVAPTRVQHEDVGVAGQRLQSTLQHRGLAQREQTGGVRRTGDTRDHCATKNPRAIGEHSTHPGPISCMAGPLLTSQEGYEGCGDAHAPPGVPRLVDESRQSVLLGDQVLDSAGPPDVHALSVVRPPGLGRRVMLD